jgi:hypothetical protein
MSKKKVTKHFVIKTKKIKIFVSKIKNDKNFVRKMITKGFCEQFLFIFFDHQFVIN